MKKTKTESQEKHVKKGIKHKESKKETHPNKKEMTKPKPKKA